MGSFGLDIGLRALLTAKSSLETVGHNITNANTEGYSRQNLHVSAARPLKIRGLQMGGGVTGDVVTRTQDSLLHRRIVSQTSLVQRLDAMAVNMGGVEGLLGEPGGFGLGGLMDGFFASVADLSTNPEDGVMRTGMTQAASSLTAQFRQLSDALGQRKDEAFERVESLTQQVNVLARQIGDLNQEIVKVEASGVVANDLRDQRDLALRGLAAEIDITFHENELGAMRVHVSGQLIVGPETVHEMRAEMDDDGEIELFVRGGTKPVTVGSGQIGGMIEFAERFVPELEAQIDRLARAMIVESNRAHSTGIPEAGGFQNLTSEYAIVDQDGDGNLEDELLSDAGLPFDLREGVLYVNVNETATGGLATHRIEVDPGRTTVGDLLEELNALADLNASLDSAGRLRLSASSGYQFDFSRRLDATPDAQGTFGSGRASIGSALPGPFNLTAGSTLDLTGPAGSFSVTFDPADFDDMSEATAGEVAAAINASPDMATNLLRAVALEDKVYLQTVGSGATESFTVDGGTAAPVLGFTPATTVNGHDTSVDVAISGAYDGDQNELFSFRPSGDGEIGTTPGLQILVENESGEVVATLDVGPDYLPGTPLAFADGLEASFSFGSISASDQDSFEVHAISDSDTSDVLVALGMNSLFTGSDAGTFALRADIAKDPSLLSASSTGSPADNGALLEMMALGSEDVQELGQSFSEFYGGVVGNVGFDISSTQNSYEVEQFLVDALDQRREQVSGVNVDEELVDMIQFEQAFGAASQFIQIINQLHDEVLNLV